MFYGCINFNASQVLRCIMFLQGLHFFLILMTDWPIYFRVHEYYPALYAE